MPRVLPGAEPDGERILNWRQLYDLPELPPELIVVGSGVTGAEFASAYQALGSQVTLVSSRERVLPHEDADAAMVVEDVFRRRGMTVLGRSRAAEVKRTRDGVVVTLEGGRTVRGSHCLLTVGMVPATRDLGLEEAGVTLDEPGVRRGGPGVPDHGPRRVRGRRLHRRDDARLGGGHAGPDRHVAHAGRGRAADPAQTTWPRRSSPSRRSPPSG